MVNDEAELPEHVRRNRVHWDALRRSTSGRGNVRGRARNRPGASGGCRSPNCRCSRRTSPARTYRARMRYGIHLSVARPTRSACGRNRQLCRPASDGPPVAA